MKSRMAAKSPREVQGVKGSQVGRRCRPGVAGEGEGALHIGDAVALVEAGEQGVVDRLEGARRPGHAEAGEGARGVGVLQQVLDLDGDVEAEAGVAAGEDAQQGEGVGHGVEEVGVAECDVAGAELDLGVDVGQDDIGRDEAQPAAVGGREGAVRAAMGAAAAGLDVAGEPLLSGPPQGPWPLAGTTVARAYSAEGGQARAIGQGHRGAGKEGGAAEASDVRELRRAAGLGHGRAVGDDTGQSISEGDEGALVLAADGGAEGAAVAQVEVEFGGVEAVEDEGEFGAARSQALGEAQGEAGGGVHGGRDGDEVGVVEGGGGGRLDGDVERADVVAGVAQGGGGRREPEGLVPLLVGRDEEDAGHGVSVPLPMAQPGPRTLGILEAIREMAR